MIPHRSRNIHRRSGLSDGIETRAENTAHSSNLMTPDAALLTEKFFARVYISGAFEIILSKEKGDEISSLGRVQLGKRLIKLLHLRHHCGKMIPHRRSEIIEGAVCLNSSEVGADLSTDTVHRMAFSAPLRTKHARTGQGILGRSYDGLRIGLTGETKGKANNHKPDERVFSCLCGHARTFSECRPRIRLKKLPASIYPQVYSLEGSQNLNARVTNPTLAVKGPLIRSPKKTDLATLALGVGTTSTSPIQGFIISTPKSFSVAWL